MWNSVCKYPLNGSIYQKIKFILLSFEYVVSIPQFNILGIPFEREALEFVEGGYSAALREGLGQRNRASKLF